jgi:alkanesulfonate monooxygenase SsuD/methylene tetrahydromethanopterin reductase-like flavin-dependent oxidoreductase (luciferase family)
MMLAKAAASLDLLTNGRVEMDIGARAFLDALAGIDGERRSPNEALAALEEALYVMRLIWSSERSVTFEGNFYSFTDTKPRPAPSHQINIWLDVMEPQALALAGQLADGWIPDPYPLVQPSDLARLSKHVDDAADAAGRSPSDVQRIWNITGIIGNEKSSTPFYGSAKQWGELLAELALDVGIDTFLLMESEHAEDQLEAFAFEVVPLTRQIVELAPGATITSGISRAYQGAAASGATRAEEETDNVDWVDETSMESFPASDPPASASFT